VSRKKLTLSVDEHAIERARRYSTSRGTSISDLVSRFLANLGARGEPSRTVSRLRGILPPDASLEDYHDHLIDKHSK